MLNLNTFEPIFFDNNGDIINHECKETVGRFDNFIQFCLPNHSKSKELWDFLNKETS